MKSDIDGEKTDREGSRGLLSVKLFMGTCVIFTIGIVVYMLLCIFIFFI